MSSNGRARSKKYQRPTFYDKRKHVQIRDVVQVDESYIQRCINVYRNDMYARESVSYISDVVFQGGVTVKVANVTYAGYNSDINRHIIEQLKRAVSWYYVCGFIPFFYKEEPRRKQKSFIPKPMSNVEKKNGQDKNYGDKANVDESQLVDILPGISSKDTKNSKSFSKASSSLNGNGTPFSAMLNINKNKNMIPNSGFDTSSNSSNFEKTSSASDLENKKFNIGSFFRVKDSDNQEPINANNGDFDFCVPELSISFARFYRYRELNSPKVKVLLRLKDDSDSDEYSSDDDDDDSSDDDKKNDLDENTYRKRYRKRKRRKRRRDRKYLQNGSTVQMDTSLVQNAIGTSNSSLNHVGIVEGPSLLTGFNADYLYENHQSSQIIVENKGTNLVESIPKKYRNAKNTFDYNSKVKNEGRDSDGTDTSESSDDEEDDRMVYYVYTCNAPDESGRPDSHFVRLLDDFDILQQQKRTEALYNHKIMYPSIVVQQMPDKQGTNLKYIRPEDTSTSNRAAAVYGNVGQSFVNAANNSPGYANGVGRRPGQNDGANKNVNIASLKTQQKQKSLFEKEALRLAHEQDLYSEAYRRNAIHELPIDFVMKMNTHSIVEGYQFVAFHTPPPPLGHEHALDTYVKKVCTTFGIPKRTFDVEVQKWKVDVTADTDPFVSRLVPVRQLLCDFFMSAFITKNGYEFNNLSGKIQSFLNTERTILDNFMNKIIELTINLPDVIATDQNKFLKQQKEILKSVRDDVEKIKVLSDLQQELDEIIMKKQMKDIKNPPKPVVIPSKSSSGSGSSSKGSVQKPNPLPQPSMNYLENSSNRGDSGSSGSKRDGLSGGKEGDERITAQDNDVYLENYEKQKDLQLIKKFILFCSDSMKKLEDIFNYVNKYQWKSVQLNFNMPLLITIDAIQKMNEILKMSDSKINDLLNAKYGIFNS